MKQWTYIEMDATHRIRVAPTDVFYPQHLMSSLVYGSDNLPGENWEYYQRKSGGFRRFDSEQTARTFLEKEIAAEKLESRELTCKN